MPPSSFAELEEIWSVTRDRWLPRESPNSVWRFSASSRSIPHQGWKLHVSASVLTASAVLETVAPLLVAHDLLFKAPSRLVELKRLNCGLFYGYTQVGKFITVYPVDDVEATAVAAALHDLTREFAAPAIPFETPVRVGSSVYTRFGSFGGPTAAADDQVIGPDGESYADRRDRNPDWAILPAGLVSDEGAASSPPQPLRHTYRAYSALMQRGKGGVYRALDLSTRPARLCLLKEGRAHGEVDWDGSDGLELVRHERQVLAELAGSAPVPEVYDYFEQGNNGYLVLEWLEGTPVADLVQPEAPVRDLGETVSLGLACAQALALVHDAGWSWRDAKPQNMLATATGIRLVDFEGARPIGTTVASPWGTAGYLPPEWLTTTLCTPAQDCYGLGVVLHQLFSRSAPVSNEAPRPLVNLRPDLPEAVLRCVTGLLEPDPDHRMTARRAVEVLTAVSVDAVAA